MNRSSQKTAWASPTPNSPCHKQRLNLPGRQMLFGKSLGVGLLLVMLSLTASLLTTSAARAVTGSDWNAGKIIDDSVFNNKGSMSVPQIQQFLNSKVPNCDRWGTQSFAGTTRRAYSEARGIVFPLTCLRDYHENPTTKVNNLEGRPIPSGAKSAAQIIWDAAQTYNINPQVLIVLLQKEQSLVTDDWPWPVQFRHATGYGCPDSAPCDSEYYGFYNQVTSAAWQFRHYANNPNSFNFVAGTTNFIRWSPNASCGGGNVFIQNQATASLYNYTPYQPNQAALNNLYGTGDGCSAYGNRNFWRLFNDWFGSTIAPPYSESIVGGGSYTSEARTQGKTTNSMIAGERAYVEVRVRNTGTATWSRSNTKLGTTSPNDRSSAFHDGSWLHYNRVARMVENTVAPNGVATFRFWYKAPNTPGVYGENFRVVVEGVSWAQGTPYYLRTVVNPKTYRAAFLSAGSYTDQTKTTGKSTKTMMQGDRAFISLRVRNISNTTWSKSNTRLGTYGPRDRASAFRDSTWMNGNRLVSMTENTVAPGQTATFEFWYKANQAGNFREYFNVVIEGASWVSLLDYHLNTRVNPLTYKAGFVNAASYADATKSVGKSTKTMTAGTRAYIVIRFKNNGTATWQKATTRLGTTFPRDRASPFQDPSWIMPSRPVTMTENTVAPGQTATFEFWYKAPTTAGTYREYFWPVIEGKSWADIQDYHLQTTVVP